MLDFDKAWAGFILKKWLGERDKKVGRDLDKNVLDQKSHLDLEKRDRENDILILSLI